MVRWALIWLVKTAYWVPGTSQEVKSLKHFNIPYSNVRPIRWGLSLENSLLQLKKKKKKNHQISVHWDLSVCCQNVHTTQCKINIAIISKDGKIIQTSIKHFLLLLLRNATKHNLIKFSAARLRVSFDKFWNFLKTLNTTMLKNVVCWWTNGLNLYQNKEEHL